MQNRSFNYVINLSFQGVNRLFVLSFKDDDDGRESHKQYYLPTVEIKDYNVMSDERNLFGQPIKNDLKTLRWVMITQLFVYYFITNSKNIIN